MTTIPFYLAFSAGLVSFLSPCILPLLPGYLSYLAGTTIAGGNGEANRRLLLWRAALFNLGFMLVFILMGAAGSLLGKWFLNHKILLLKLGGAIIFVMGLQMTGLLRLPFLYRTYQVQPGGKKISGSWGALLLGFTFAVGWTPCVGPVLASILVYAGMAGTVTRGVILLGVYALGLAVPFMLAALGIGGVVKYIHRLNRYLPYISVGSGIVLMLIGILLFLNIFPRLTAYLIF